MVRQRLVDSGKGLPLDTCFTLRQGKDVTLVSWGAAMHETLQAAERLARDGIECEVIDVATISPLDFDTIKRSVQHTGRCVIVQEAPRNGGVASEISARLAETCLMHLRAPVQRVTGYDATMPYPRQEHLYMPASDDIIAAARTTLEGL